MTDSPSTPSVADELRKLVELRDEGALSAEEFSMLKERLLKGAESPPPPISPEPAPQQGRPEIKVKTYPNSSAADRDAKRMVAAGWEQKGMTGGGDRFAGGRAVASVALLGPIGLLGNRKERPLQITWVRSPENAAVFRGSVKAAVEKVEKGFRLTAAERGLLTFGQHRAARRKFKESQEAEEREKSRTLELASGDEGEPQTPSEVSTPNPSGREKEPKRRRVRAEGKGAAPSKKDWMHPPGGWYEDPTDPTQLRWWDGNEWSPDVRPKDAET